MRRAIHSTEKRMYHAIFTKSLVIRPDPYMRMTMPSHVTPQVLCIWVHSSNLISGQCARLRAARVLPGELGRSPALLLCGGRW